MQFLKRIFADDGLLVEYFQTGRGQQGLRINNFTFKRHYETSNSIYYICTLNNKLRCKQRVIVERDKPFVIKFKGKSHCHDLDAYGPLPLIRNIMTEKMIKYESVFQDDDDTK